MIDMETVFYCLRQVKLISISHRITALHSECLSAGASDIFNMAMPIFREITLGSQLWCHHISRPFAIGCSSLIFPTLPIHVPRNRHFSEVSVVRIPVSLYFRTLSTASYPQMDYGGLCAISLSDYCSWSFDFYFLVRVWQHTWWRPDRDHRPKICDTK